MSFLVLPLPQSSYCSSCELSCWWSKEGFSVVLRLLQTPWIWASEVRGFQAFLLLLPTEAKLGLVFGVSLGESFLSSPCDTGYLCLSWDERLNFPSLGSSRLLLPGKKNDGEGQRFVCFLGAANGLLQAHGANGALSRLLPHPRTLLGSPLEKGLETSVNLPAPQASCYLNRIRYPNSFKLTALFLPMV